MWGWKGGPGGRDAGPRGVGGEEDLVGRLAGFEMLTTLPGAEERSLLSGSRVCTCEPCLGGRTQGAADAEEVILSPCRPPRPVYTSAGKGDAVPGLSDLFLILSLFLRGGQAGRPGVSKRGKQAACGRHVSLSLEWQGKQTARASSFLRSSNLKGGLRFCAATATPGPS